MNRLLEIRDALKALADIAKTRALTDEERASRDALVTEGDALRAQIENDARRAADDARAEELLRWAGLSQGRRTQPEGGDNRDGNTAGEFRSFGEFVEAVALRRNDERLRSVSTSDGGVGFLLPANIHSTVLALDPMAEIIAPRATVIPAGNQPDAGDIFPAMVQGSGGLFAGIAFEWTKEGGTPTESKPTMKPIELNPQELIGTWTVTNRVLRNASMYSTMLEKTFRNALMSVRDAAFINGDGVGKPMGILRAPGKIDVTRNTASTIKFEDVCALRQAIHPDLLGQAIWLAASNARATIEGMSDTYKRPIYGQADISQGRPNMLMGTPIFYHTQKAFAAAGDLALVVPGAYLYKQGFGPALAISEHVNFKSGEVVFRLVQSLDGQCWLPAPVTLENGHQVSVVAVLK